ncbi:MAG: hypothetical protein ACREQW_07375 [Candidatus Binatia bacterium]
MLKKLLEFLGLGSANEENGSSHGAVSALKTVYHTQFRLAEQIKAHARIAPYPHVAERLRRVAEEKSNVCETLKGTLLKLGSYLEAEPVLAIKSGRNHWERMAQDLKDQSFLEQMLQKLSGYLLHDEPEIRELLRRVLAAEIANREALTALLMRADPQADQT